MGRIFLWYRFWGAFGQGLVDCFGGVKSTETKEGPPWGIKEGGFTRGLKKLVSSKKGGRFVVFAGA